MLPCVPDKQHLCFTHQAVVMMILLQEAAAAGCISMHFGSPQCKQQLFALDPSFTYLNHGSYGAAFRWVCGLDALTQTAHG
jgi:hypothetical protein